VTIHEGKNRQVRRLGDHAGTPVDRLARLSHAGISTDGLRPGEWRLLSTDELKDLKKTFGVPEKLRGILEMPRQKSGASRGIKKVASPPRRPASAPRKSADLGGRPEANGAGAGGARRKSADPGGRPAATGAGAGGARANTKSKAPRSEAGASRTKNERGERPGSPAGSSNVRSSKAGPAKARPAKAAKTSGAASKAKGAKARPTASRGRASSPRQKKRR
jgi:23S rRNA pseudouridine2605 synthase